jgi:cytoskeletal protein CcmA (bactofilin family)
MLLALFITASAWLLLAFMPALTELRQRKDADPLPISDTYLEDVRHAPPRFESNTRLTLDAMDLVTINRALQQGPPPLRKLPVDGYPLEGRQDPFILNSREPRTLLANLVFQREVFATNTVWGGPNNTFEALYGEQDVHLAPGSIVVRWLHAQGMILVAEACTLHGSVSSEQAIRVEQGCYFERLHAPDVEFGTARIYPMPWNREDTPRLPVRLSTLQRVTETAAFTPSIGTDGTPHTLIQGDLSIPPNHHLLGDLVVRGTLHLGTGSHLSGNIKAHGDLILEHEVQVHGNVFSNRSVSLGRNCYVRGVVSAEANLTVATGCQLGTRAKPTTVGAHTITIAPGVRAHGTIWAAERGFIG